MICYRDMTFCSRGEGCTCSEWRKLTPEVEAKAQKSGLPVAYGVLCNPPVNADETGVTK